MTRIDFYLLSGSGTRQRWLTASKLVEKAYRQGHSLYVMTTDEDATQAMDDLLWTFRQGSFVPHEPMTLPLPEAPVILGHAPPPADLSDVLVNLSEAIPPGYERFNRLAELIDQDESVRQAGRQRYRHYQEAGHELVTHRLE